MTTDLCIHRYRFSDRRTHYVPNYPDPVYVHKGSGSSDIHFASLEFLRQMSPHLENPPPASLIPNPITLLPSYDVALSTLSLVMNVANTGAADSVQLAIKDQRRQ